MNQSKLAVSLAVGALSVGLVATGCSSDTEDRNPVEDTAPAPADDLVDNLSGAEKKALDILSQDPNRFNLDNAASKAAGIKITGVDKFFKTKLHNNLYLVISGARSARAKITNRKTGKVVKRGKVRNNDKYFDLARGKYKVTATHKKKTATHPFKITKKHGANVLLRLK